MHIGCHVYGLATVGVLGNVSILLCVSRNASTDTALAKHSEILDFDTVTATDVPYRAFFDPPLVSGLPNLDRTLWEVSVDEYWSADLEQSEDCLTETCMTLAPLPHPSPDSDGESDVVVVGCSLSSLFSDGPRGAVTCGNTKEGNNVRASKTTHNAAPSPSIHLAADPVA